MTTASLHQAMVEALRANQCRPELRRDQGRRIAGNIACRARAALEGWEKRAPLRQEGAMRDVVARFLVLYRRGEFAPAEDVTSMLLDALEALLFGERD